MRDGLWSAVHQLLGEFERLLDKAEIPGAFASESTGLGAASVMPSR